MLEILKLVIELFKSGKVIALVLFALVVFYVLPLLIISGLSYDNTNRLERAQREGASQIVNSVERLGNRMEIKAADARGGK